MACKELTDEVLACLYKEQRASDLHMVQLMPCHPIISCFTKIQTGLTFLVLAHPGRPGNEAIKPVSS